MAAAVVGMAIAQHAWRAEWRVGEEPHIGEVQLEHSLNLFGVDIKPVAMQVDGLWLPLG